MMNWLMAALFSFVLFLVLFPLFGLLLGLLARVVFPYALVGVVATIVLATRGTLSSDWWLLGIPATLWACLVFGARISRSMRSMKKLSWQEGHYRAALRVITLGRLGAATGRVDPLQSVQLRAEEA